MDMFANSTNLGRTNNNNNRNRNLRRKTKHSRSVMYQSLWYVIAFYLSFTFATMARIYGSVTGKPAPFPLLLLFSIFFPLQGFFNFVVYMRSRIRSNERSKQMRRRNDDV